MTFVSDDGGTHPLSDATQTCTKMLLLCSFEFYCYRYKLGAGKPHPKAKHALHTTCLREITYLSSSSSHGTALTLVYRPLTVPMALAQTT